VAALATVALAALPGAPPALATILQNPAPGVARTTLPAVEAQVMCVTCKIPLDVADSPQADRERAYIQGLIDQGRTLAQVKRALVYQYGSEVLALPPARGVDIGVYVIPAVVVVFALGTAVFLLPRWRRRARRAQDARDAEQLPRPGTLSAADEARLQADMARFD
jgi:cytochrome c-type biogenesis protein CcmH